MRKKLSKKSREDLTRIANTLAQLAEAVLLLVEREMHEVTDKDLETPPRKIAKAMQSGRRVTPDEVTRYALSLQQSVYNPKIKVRAQPRHITEIKGDLVDVERTKANSRGRDGAELDAGPNGPSKKIDSEGCD
jgi:hypothetical protein